MTRRELFFASMRRTGCGYIPFEFVLCPSLEDTFEKETGTRDYSEYYGFPQRNLWLPCLCTTDRFLPYFTDLNHLKIDPAFGFGQRMGDIEHFFHMEPSMHQAENIEDFVNYPYPDPERDFDWSALSDQIRQLRENDWIAVAPMEMTIFETAWYIRGMEDFLMDLLSDPDFAAYQLERITQIREEMARRYAAAGADVLRLGDDVATQRGMMMSPEIWRRELKPRLARVIAAAKSEKPDLLVFYHGDGDMFDILGDLIEIGVDILNPIQPECMSPQKVYDTYGDRVSLWGCIGTQSTMPFGSADDVRRECQKLIDRAGARGGLLLAPSHMLEPEVPMENIRALIETVQEHNQAILKINKIYLQV